MTIQEVIEYLENDTSFDDYAFRGDDFIPERDFNNSYYHGDDEAEYELPGVSAIFIPAFEESYITKSIEKARHYGKNVFLLRGQMTNADDVNHDPDELIMMNNEIIAIVVD